MLKLIITVCAVPVVKDNQVTVGDSGYKTSEAWGGTGRAAGYSTLESLVSPGAHDIVTSLLSLSSR